MSMSIILPHVSDAGLQWREYKGYTLACGDCVDCEVVKGKAVAKSVFTWSAADGVAAVIGKRKITVIKEKAA